jgi:anti-sigma-K factor RskA
MTDAWDDEDRAIARALDAMEDDEVTVGDAGDGDASDGTIDLEALDDYRTALSHLPFDEVTPPSDLEARVMAEAVTRRPSTTVSLDRARYQRRSRIRWAAIATATVAAAAIVAALLVDTDRTTQPSGSIETVAAQRADVDAALADPATRTGTLSGAGVQGLVALDPDGSGFVYDLDIAPTTNSPTAWLWLDTRDGPVRVGELPAPAPGDVEFTVDGDVDEVRSIGVSFEPAGETPEKPSADAVTATLR